MNSNYIEDDEQLFRAVYYPYHWKKEFKKPSSALFKDKNGVSVDRDGERKKENILKSFK